MLRLGVNLFIYAVYNIYARAGSELRRLGKADVEVF